MKCKYCNAEIEQDARFCPNCGKDLSSLARCVNCGEFLDDVDAFCPHCGAKQPQQEVVEDVIEDEGKDNSTRNFLIALLLAFALAGAAWFYFTKDSNNPTVTKVDVDTLRVDTLSKEVDKVEDNDSQIVFIKKLYDDFYSMEQQVFLKKYFTPSAMKKIYVESSYEDGSYLYATDFVVTGIISDLQPDYDKVSKRNIEHYMDNWFVVTNIWDGIDKSAKVLLEVKKVDGHYMITDVQAEKNEETNPSVEDKKIEKENYVAEPKEAEKVDNDEPVALVSPKEDNVAWFVFGTKKELENNRVISNGKVYFNNMSYFTKIDIRIDKEIKLYSKSAKILTNHPASSYSLVPNDNMQYVLRINDPQLFWSTSKYLVILVS